MAGGRGDAGMRVVEIRDLDGPNIFLLEPVIKAEFAFDDEADLLSSVERLFRSTPKVSAEAGSSLLERIEIGAREFIGSMHNRNGMPEPAVTVRAMETPSQISVAFGWTRRAFALGLADKLSAVMLGELRIDAVNVDPLDDAPGPDDRPLMITDAERRIRVVGVTGTNGKTTTTRLLAHLLMQTGLHVGWSSTSGVYIDGEEVLQGDYSGPAGARRAINDPVVEVAVVETARGGILLRGFACESNDVSVFTNVSSDHLNLHGIRTVEGLADVKAVVVRTTRPEGTAVLNADDPLVVSSCRIIRANKLYFSKETANPVISAHLDNGGRALVLDRNAIVLTDGQSRTEIANLSYVPMTFDGRAIHMIENALAAAGAAIGLGIGFDEIAEGLHTFTSSSDQNPGRLNVFDRGGVTVILDFAHNESGLSVLLEFAEKLVAENGRITVMIGTAGDRTSESLREIGRIAATGASRVIVKRTEKYERGRSNEEMIELYREGALIAGNSSIEVAQNEIEGLRMALENTQPGDVVALMCQEHVPEVAGELRETARPLN
jgi:cyanophycin synthetase